MPKGGATLAAPFFKVSRLNIDFEKELNPDQYAAVTSPPDRPALVLAGAGSGKTRTLTYRVAWLISECGFSPREILLLTFTNKAANQMLARISDLTGYKPYEFWGGTFHSVGNKFLRIEGSAIGLEPNFTILDSEDSEKVLKRCVEENFPRFFANKDNPKAKLLREIISYARNTRSSIRNAMAERFSWLETSADTITEIAVDYDAAKRQQNFCDFDDLLELWYKLLKNNPEILKKYQNRFRNILVDEYQDTNMLQSSVLDLLADRGQISAVGDDAQCIYSWRGAEIENILHFRDRYPAANIYKIERNYRSTAQILNFANQILADMPGEEAYRKVLIPAREGRCKPIVIQAMDGVSQGKRVAETIQEVVMGGEYDYSDIAVLYRSHFQAMDLQLQLQYKNIPFVMTSGLKFFEQAHIKDVIAQVKFVTNPKDSVSFLRFTKFLPKVGEKTAFKIFDLTSNLAAKKQLPAYAVLGEKEIVAKVPAVSRDLFKIMAEDLDKLGRMVEASKSRVRPENVLERGVDEEKISQTDFFAHFESQKSEVPPKKEEPKADAEAVEECAPKDLIKRACEGWYSTAMKTTYEDWEDRAMDFDALYDYASRFSDFDDFLANVTLEISEAEGREGAEDSSRIRLMTVHQAKGLEFPVVFVIGAADGLFPSKRSIDDDTIDEERRLFYVAATRAMDYLILSYPRVNVSQGNYEMREPSRFLMAVDPALYDES